MKKVSAWIMRSYEHTDEERKGDRRMGNTNKFSFSWVLTSVRGFSCHAWLMHTLQSSSQLMFFHWEHQLRGAASTFTPPQKKEFMTLRFVEHTFRKRSYKIVVHLGTSTATLKAWTMGWALITSSSCNKTASQPTSGHQEDGWTGSSAECQPRLL